VTSITDCIGGTGMGLYSHRLSRPRSRHTSGTSRERSLPRRAATERAQRLLLEVDRLREEGITSGQALAGALAARVVPMSRDGAEGWQSVDPHDHGTIAGREHWGGMHPAARDF
jgi:hypothetical protein